MDQSREETEEHRKSASRLSGLLSTLKLDRENPFHEQIILEMLNIPHNHRSRAIRQTLAQWLDCIEFFSELNKKHGDQYVKKFYSYLSGEKYKQGQLMIRTGDDSLFFYVVLSGSVMVLYPRSKADIEEDSKNIDSTEAKNVSLKERILRRPQNQRHFRNVPISAITNYERYFNQLGVPVVSVENVLEKGRGFGELGILYKTKRMADIVCRQDCLVAKISRDKYLKLVGDESQKKITERLAFLARYFSSHIGNMARSEAQRYLYLFEEVEWKVNAIIVPVDTPLKGLFLITQGFITLRTPKIQSGQGNLKSIQRYGIFRSNRKKQLVAFKQLGFGQSFGIQEFLKTNREAGLKYNYEASAGTKCKILYCSLAKLIPILKQDKELDRQLRKIFDVKEHLSPIRSVLSPEARLESYSEKTKTCRPTYRLSNILFRDNCDVIRSPKTQSLHNSRENILLSQICDDYRVCPVTSRWHHEKGQKQANKQNKNKVMSRALQLCVMQDIANSFKKRMKLSKRHRHAASFDMKLVEQHLDRKNMERRARHLRKW